MSNSRESNHPIFRVECINPILRVKEMPVSRHFYVEVLGFREAEWGDDQFTCVTRDSSCIYLCQGAQGQPGMWLWLGFDGDIHDVYNELIAKGVAISRPPTNYPWAFEMHVEDPDGHVLRFATEPDNDQPFASRRTRHFYSSESIYNRTQSPTNSHQLTRVALVMEQFSSD
ncbi:MAG: VOC family protein [Paenibacillaceae bacterium]|nr:VOC family protein [Paenibacillaceae bacterium]